MSSRSSTLPSQSDSENPLEDHIQDPRLIFAKKVQDDSLRNIFYFYPHENRSSFSTPPQLLTFSHDHTWCVHERNSDAPNAPKSYQEDLYQPITKKLSGQTSCYAVVPSSVTSDDNFVVVAGANFDIFVFNTRTWTPATLSPPSTTDATSASASSAASASASSSTGNGEKQQEQEEKTANNFDYDSSAHNNCSDSSSDYGFGDDDDAVSKKQKEEASQIPSDARLKGHTGNILCLATCPQNPNRVCSVSRDGTGIVWNLKERTQQLVLDHNKNAKILSDKFKAWMLTSVSFSRDGTVIATGSSKGHLVTWLVEESGQCCDVQKIDSMEINDIRFFSSATSSTDLHHHRLLIGSDDGFLTLLMISGDESVDRGTILSVLWSINVQGSYINGIAISRDELFCAVCSDDRGITMHRCSDGAMIGEQMHAASQTFRTNCCCFNYSPVIPEIVCAAVDGFARVWSLDELTDYRWSAKKICILLYHAGNNREKNISNSEFVRCFEIYRIMIMVSAFIDWVEQIPVKEMEVRNITIESIKKKTLASAATGTSSDDDENDASVSVESNDF